MTEWGMEVLDKKLRKMLLSIEISEIIVDTIQVSG
jgi:hypothetical protein